MKGGILILDFGAQYAHLIARRLREAHVYAELIRHDTPLEAIKAKEPRGLILSGGPASVYQEGAPRCDPRIFDAGLPILGICYGLQLIVDHFGGKVVKAGRREYGRALLKVERAEGLFSGLEGELVCWMSHGDAVERLPQGFTILASTANSFAAAIRHEEKPIYCVQFHPEVAHTTKGREILENFAFRICGCEPSWRMEAFLERAIRSVRERVGDERVLCALSGGIDSSTTAALIHRAIGERLTCVFIDHGLLRKGEVEEVLLFAKDFCLLFIDAKERFLSRLKGVRDPEEKRKIIGDEFAKVFQEVNERHGPFQWLAQGTLYPDVIESSATGSPASLIKSHHNVAGLPPGLPFKLLEPLRELYKDEVRKVAQLLGLPQRMVKRHPFPGPGLAVRIIGEINEEKLRICREASAIVEEELERAGFYDKVWQAFAVVGDDKAVGILGDERSYGYMVTIKVVESQDAMTADWARLPYEVLDTISRRITNEVEGVTWVNYAISSKPPSTIEPQ